MAPPKVIRSERYDVPQQFHDLAQRRTEFLFRHIQHGDMPMRHVIASAYFQGMNDCVDTLDARDLIKDSTDGARQDG